MRCFNCGENSAEPLCENCRTEEVLSWLWKDLSKYDVQQAQSPYLIEYVLSLGESYDKKQLTSSILDLFEQDVTYYRCLSFYWFREYDIYTNVAEDYLSKHPLVDKKSQKLLFHLMEIYVNNYYKKAYDWANKINETDGLCCDLYIKTVTIYSKIGDYDIAEELIKKLLQACEDENNIDFLEYTKETWVNALNDLLKKNTGYRTKPFRPKTEDRKNQLLPFYEERGIVYGSSKSTKNNTSNKKIKESEFVPLTESEEQKLQDYCTFWCEEAFGLKAPVIYQIAAIKVRDGQLVDEFQSLIRPWDGNKAFEQAAKKANISVEMMKEAPTVKEAMTNFFAFVEDNVLISTDVFGSQRKLISRAARYNDMKQISNSFLDSLDVAAEINPKFDLENNSREYLLSHFSISEGKDALEKALNNVLIYQNLMNYGEE